MFLGWGRYESNSKEKSPILRKMDVYISKIFANPFISDLSSQSIQAGGISWKENGYSKTSTARVSFIPEATVFLIFKTFTLKRNNVKKNMYEA